MENLYHHKIQWALNLFIKCPSLPNQFNLLLTTNSNLLHILDTPLLNQCMAKATELLKLEEVIQAMEVLHQEASNHQEDGVNQFKVTVVLKVTDPLIQDPHPRAIIHQDD